MLNEAQSVINKKNEKYKTMLCFILLRIKKNHGGLRVMNKFKRTYHYSTTFNDHHGGKKWCKNIKKNA